MHFRFVIFLTLFHRISGFAPTLTISMKNVMLFNMYFSDDFISLMFRGLMCFNPTFYLLLVCGAIFWTLLKLVEYDGDQVADALLSCSVTGSLICHLKKYA